MEILMNRSAAAQHEREGPDVADTAMMERAEEQWGQLGLVIAEYLSQRSVQRVQQGTGFAESV